MERKNWYGEDEELKNLKNDLESMKVFAEFDDADFFKKESINEPKENTNGKI